MAAPELRKPHRSDYASDSDFLDACVTESAAYTRAMLRSINRSAARASISVDARTRDAYDEYRKYGRQKTLHEHLSENPALLRRYKEKGAEALFEI